MEALRRKYAEEEELERRRIAKEKTDAEDRLRRQLLDHDVIERSAVAVRTKNKEKELVDERERDLRKLEELDLRAKQKILDKAKAKAPTKK